MSIIKAQELRIGNWVHHKGDWSYRQGQDFKEFDFQWDFSDWYALGECTMSEEIVEPIPLTEEWLVKFGFEKANRINIHLGMSKTPVWANHSFSITVWEDGSLFYDWMGGNIEVKYVHQLQNLYFALTGEELKA